MTFDPARLFEPARRARAPRSDTSELDAVATGRKPMAMFVGDPDEAAEWSALAAARSLIASHHADPMLGERSVFVTRPEQLWRVAAYLALWETAFVDGRWSDAAENLASYLLGYSKAARKAWLAAQRQAFPAWTATTVYALLTGPQRAATVALGRRCFAGPDVTLFVARGVVRPTAFARVPRGVTLARAGLALEVAQRLFARTASVAVTPARAPAIHAAMRSSVQLLTRTGWR